jgi:ABC-type nitrate/sulfonate/bicarbonate transport system substrate-binding protein
MQILKQGRVDCFVASLPVVVGIRAMGDEIVAWSTDRYAPTPGQCYVTTQQVIDAKPAILTRAMKALTASAKEMVEQPLKPIFERAAKDYDIPGIKNVDALVAAEKAVIEQLWLSEGKENLMRNVPKLWTSAVTALRESKIGQPSDAETLYTNKFV